MDELATLERNLAELKRMLKPQKKTTTAATATTTTKKNLKVEYEFNEILVDELLNYPIPIEQNCKHKFVFRETQTRRGDEIENETAICLSCGYHKNT